MKQQLGHYCLEKLLGEGTFAWVYQALDQKLDRQVALKVLKPAWLNDPEALGRFQREARTMARLHHPHIVEIYDVEETEGQVYLAQFLVCGETLEQQVKGTPLSWPEILSIVQQVASALDYAHSLSIIHRDIKPANILLDQRQQAYLTDFGLVGAAEGSIVLSSISDGIVGTPAYMAPEQWQGNQLTAATDMYALGCVVVEMLTGQILFDGPTPSAVITKHVIEGPEFPTSWPTGVPAGVTGVLRRGLAKDPGKRFKSAGELVAALTALSPPSQPPIVPVYDEFPTISALPADVWLIGPGEQSYKLKLGRLTLGRGQSCDIQLDDPLASRRHATLEFDGQICTLIDEGSANGTFVNEQPITSKRHPFNPGDHLRIGQTSLHLSTVAPAGSNAPTTDSQPGLNNGSRMKSSSASAKVDTEAKTLRPAPSPRRRSRRPRVLKRPAQQSWLETIANAVILISLGVILVLVSGALIWFILTNLASLAQFIP